VRAAVMREIERQASVAWGMGQAVAASDFMHVIIPPTEESSVTNQDARSGGRKRRRRSGG